MARANFCIERAFTVPQLRDALSRTQAHVTPTSNTAEAYQNLAGPEVVAAFFY